MTLRLALYKGPAQDLAHKIAHWAVCLFTGSPYSHCELVINGVCWSASARDGGVRGKVIDLHSGKWDVVELDEAFRASDAIAWFQSHAGEAYDWAGVMRFALPFLPQRSKQWFCSEACAAAMGISRAHELTPETLAQMFAKS